MDIETIRNRVRAGNYSIKSHAIQHALKEGFDRAHIVEAILNGTVIEEYPVAQRVLVNGHAKILKDVSVHLHVVCECADPVYVEIVTAYIPDETEWARPDFTRRKRKR